MVSLSTRVEVKVISKQFLLSLIDSCLDHKAIQAWLLYRGSVHNLDPLQLQRHPRAQLSQGARGPRDGRPRPPGDNPGPWPCGHGGPVLRVPLSRLQVWSKYDKRRRLSLVFDVAGILSSITWCPPWRRSGHWWIFGCGHTARRRPGTLSQVRSGSGFGDECHDISVQASHSTASTGRWSARVTCTTHARRPTSGRGAWRWRWPPAWSGTTWTRRPPPGPAPSSLGMNAIKQNLSVYHEVLFGSCLCKIGITKRNLSNPFSTFWDKY